MGQISQREAGDDWHQKREKVLGTSYRGVSRSCALVSECLCQEKQNIAIPCVLFAPTLTSTLHAAESAINVLDLFHGLGYMNPADVKLWMPYVFVPRHPQQPRAKWLMLQG